MTEQTSFEVEFNKLIVDTFHNILKTELKMINKITNSGLSMREVHLLEIVGDNQDITVSKIAKSFEITLASVTVMVNKLADLGYITKTKSDQDARIIYITLTEKGHAINKEHTNFHKNMIQRITKNLTEEQKKLLANGVKVLNEMFKSEFDKI